MVVQFLIILPETHPAHLPVNHGQWVWVSVTVRPKQMKEIIWRYCCHLALKTIYVAGVRGICMHVVSILPPEIVRRNAPNNSTKTAIVRSTRSTNASRCTHGQNIASPIVKVAHIHTCTTCGAEPPCNSTTIIARSETFDVLFQQTTRTRDWSPRRRKQTTNGCINLGLPTTKSNTK